MRRYSPARVGRLLILLASSLLLCLVLLARSHWVQNPNQSFRQSTSRSGFSSNIYHLLNLTEAECRITFPDLTTDLDAMVALGPFTLQKSHGTGPLQARIKDGELYIIHAENINALSPELLQAREAALHQINRALITSPETLPNTVFSLNIRDQPYGTAWSYSRPAFAAPAAALPPIKRAFLMPHFAFWSWPLPSIGSVARAAEAIARIESALPFARKDPRVVWRGSARFNGVYRPTLRRDLLRATAGAAWADVRALESYEMESPGEATFEGGGDGGKSWAGTGKGEKWKQDAAKRSAGDMIFPERGLGSKEARNRIDGEDDDASSEGNSTAPMMIEDFCRYKYVLYTDGVTYSGRLPFLQMCRSVLLTPPFAWHQRTTHLVRPLFSSDLGLGTPLHENEWAFSSDVRKAWPAHYSPAEANAVFVAPDWSDLESTVSWLEAHADVAEGIAQRQRDLFVGRGYISPAEETCYWRALIRAWSSVVRLEGNWWRDQVGGSWNEFSLG
ncbi:glycosyl transferase family 90-domain-containing protein [Astrocystis sublimbata]|nr:glycosyl transferase family 90-domain-containing protein [Astrocystis sublimbata]